ncbi:MAG: YXWGXW repeat-containing protein, partial [Isosphaeraceae bacterium]
GVFWSPGNWYWQGERYVWQPGFWAATQTNWVWVPPHYVYTPGGYLFVAGYWDLPLANRGLLFAPVYYPQPVYMQPAYVFTPSITIATPGLVANLFVQPAFGCYCFGDYYAQSYVSLGIFPWFSFSYVSGPARPVFYDPVFTFYASINVTRDPGWVTRIRSEYIVRRDNVALRPPRTLIEQTRIVERGGGGRSIVMTRSIQEIARNPAAAGGTRLERLNAATQRRWQERGAQLAQFRDQRTRLERQAGSEWRAGRGSALAARPRRLALPASPVAAPIHQHAASGSPIGPSGHSDRQTAMRQTAEHTGPRYEQQTERGLGQGARGAAGAPLFHNDLQSREELLREGQAAPHDVSRSPLLGSRSPTVGHEQSARSAFPWLHAPPQYTHRQPPAAPRPQSRSEYREERRDR